MLEVWHDTWTSTMGIQSSNSYYANVPVLESNFHGLYAKRVVISIYWANCDKQLPLNDILDSDLRTLTELTCITREGPPPTISGGIWVRGQFSILMI